MADCTRNQLKICQGGKATKKTYYAVLTVPFCHSQEEWDPEDGVVEVDQAENSELPGSLNHPI